MKGTTMFLYLFTLIQTLKSDRQGVTALEYGLIASLVAVVIITAVKLLGTNLSSQYTTIANAV
jgi:pilus assembly protein Flp/PilA